jgi:hypothetical protein
MLSFESAPYTVQYTPPATCLLYMFFVYGSGDGASIYFLCPRYYYFMKPSCEWFFTIWTFTWYRKGKYFLCEGVNSCYPPPTAAASVLRCSSREGETAASCMRSLSMSSTPPPPSYPPLPANTCEKTTCLSFCLSLFFPLHHKIT